MRLGKLKIVACLAVCLVAATDAAMRPEGPPITSEEHIGYGADAHMRLEGSPYEAFYFAKDLGHVVYNYRGPDDVSQNWGWKVSVWEITDTDATGRSVDAMRIVSGGTQASTATLQPPTSTRLDVDVGNATAAWEQEYSFVEFDALSNPAANFTFAYLQTFTVPQNAPPAELVFNKFKASQGETRFHTDITGWETDAGEPCCRAVRLTFQVEAVNHVANPRWMSAECGDGAVCQFALHPELDWLAIEEQEERMHADQGPPGTQDDEPMVLDRGVGELMLRLPNEMTGDGSELRWVEVWWEEVPVDAEGGIAMRVHAVLPTTTAGPAYRHIRYAGVRTYLFSAAATAQPALTLTALTLVLTLRQAML